MQCGFNITLLLKHCPLLIGHMYYTLAEDGHKLTFFGQDSDADARVAQFDEGGVPSPPVVLSDQKNVFSADISMDKMFFFLYIQKRRDESFSYQHKETNHSITFHYFSIKVRRSNYTC